MKSKTSKTKTTNTSLLKRLALGTLGTPPQTEASSSQARAVRRQTAMSRRECEGTAHSPIIMCSHSGHSVRLWNNSGV